MKKILITLVTLVTLLATADAKVIKINLVDGRQMVFTSSELAYIEFSDDGTMTVTSYDFQQIQFREADYESVEINDDATFTDQYPDMLNFNIDADGIPVDLGIDRNIMKLNYVYPSTDRFGEPVTLSGTILIPEEIWNGEARSEGIMMVNHYTKFHRDEAPTISNGELENMLLANPLKPNYIIVESDFYGFGATVRFPQAFLQGTVNARASLDGLLAARQLLDAMGFEYGPLCFNIGYSSGGFDALASQKLRDMEYADRISFDKTFAGGSPNDVRKAYQQYVTIDKTAYNAVPLLLMVCTNETQKLNLKYEDIFQPYIADQIPELILSKSYSSWPVCDKIGREKYIHEILLPTYCDLESPESQAMQELFRQFSLTNDDWTPDLSQRLYIFHSRGDDYVPIQSARPIIPFLKDKGFTPSIIPGRTNLQTNFVVPKLGHLSATLVYFIQTLAAVKAWPEMYTDGELNPIIAQLVNIPVPDLVMMMRQLDTMGFDCRSIINTVASKLMGGGEEAGVIDPLMIAMLVDEALAKLGLTAQDLLEMSEDSGLDLRKFINDLIAYLTEVPESTDDANGEEPGGDNPGGDNAPQNNVMARKALLLKAYDSNLTPAERYERQLKEQLSQYLK